MESEQYKREWMVQQQIAARGVEDERVLQAMREVPRHLFIPPEVRDHAYVDCPVGIGHGQTISQPYIVGLMTALLDVKADHRVLDVGTGSGYQAAILAELAGEVHSIERHPELAESARMTLEELGYQNVLIHTGDGTGGYPAGAPYDRILVGASAPSAPEPLLAQLAPGGRLVIPVGSRFSQRLEVWDRTDKGFTHTSSIPVMFVPLIGKYGWAK
jgi:protein-L-isoaspartate(D-aspartate) O-methyltransferase